MEPRRIVSLVPSLTDLVWWLGAGERLIGRTRFCTEPAAEIESVPAMGGTKNPNLERIILATPDLVLANKEENRREDIEALRAAGLGVLLSDPNSVHEAVAMILELGRLLGADVQAQRLAGEIECELGAGMPAESVRVYTGVWHNPMMGLGSETYGHSLLEACGATNVLAHRPRYPEVSMEQLRGLSPELILLPDEPFPFDEGHAALYGEVAPAHVIDGKLLWWYGPRIPSAIRELRTLLAGGR